MICDLSNLIIELNYEFKLKLINNGVSECNLKNEDEIMTEDLRLISLWVSCKYSIESLNECLILINNYYNMFSSSNYFDKLLKTIKKNIDDIIKLMVDYKHMGAIGGMNDCLLISCKLVLYSVIN
jgi:hypothetical protein